MLARMRCGFTDLGMTMKPFWKAHRMQSVASEQAFCWASAVAATCRDAVGLYRQRSSGAGELGQRCSTEEAATGQRRVSHQRDA